MTKRPVNPFLRVLDRPWKWGVAVALAFGLLIASMNQLRPNRPADYREPEARTVTRVPADDGAARAIYVPVYSHVYYGGGRPHLLEVTLSVRNLEVDRTLRVQSVDYYDTDGRFIRSFISAPLEIRPLGTVEYLIPQVDISGGSGANFIVTWAPLDDDSRAPLIQAVMVGREGNRSFSFVCTGVPIDKAPAKSASSEGDGDGN